MKSIENKTTDINFRSTPDSEPHKATYIDLINEVFTVPRQTHFDWAHMEAWVAFDKIRKADKEEPKQTIEFEDAHFNYLKKLLGTMNWSFLHGDLLTFKEDINATK